MPVAKKAAERMPGLRVDVIVEETRWRKKLPGLGAAAKAMIRAGLKTSARTLLPGSALAIVFSNDAAVKALNRRFRGRDKATNVLAFPDSISPIGGIVLALETIEREAKAQNKTFASHAKHLILHGFLHLLGYDHETVAERRLMEALEIDILAAMGIADPYRPSPNRNGATRG